MPIAEDFAAVWLTLQLATIVTALLLFIGTPIAWWLAHTKSRLKGPVGAIVALPLVLPPTVLGFYMLLAIGAAWPYRQVDERARLRRAAVHIPAARHRLR